MADQDTVKPGTRLKCEQCGSEAVVVRGDGPDLACCGAPMSVTFSGKAKS
jgi:hypothetical protein